MLDLWIEASTRNRARVNRNKALRKNIIERKRVNESESISFRFRRRNLRAKRRENSGKNFA